MQALREQGRWCGDEDPDWSLPSWMEAGYDPMDDRAYWLARISEADGAGDAAGNRARPDGIA